MSRFSKWSGRPTRPERRQRVRLGVEALEERAVPTVGFVPQYGAEGFVDNQGLKLNDVPVFLIFEGQYWQNTTSDPTGKTPTAAEVTADVQKILGGPYLQTVTQYGANGLAHLAANPYFTNNNLTSGQFDSGRLADIVDGLQDDGGGLPEYDDLSRIPLYVVITPPNVMSSTAKAASFNGMQYDSDFPYTDVDKIPLIWLGGNQPNGIPANGTIRDWYSDNFSHELAEAITDINGDGIRVSAPSAFVATFGSGATGQEIGDNEAAFYTYRINGTLMQSLWSQQDGLYRVSDGTSQLFYVTNIPNVGPTLIVNGDQHPGAPDDAVTVGVAQTGPSKGGVWVSMDGETVQFENGQLNQIQINTGSGQDVVNVESLPAGVPVFVSKFGGGNGVVNVSPTAGNLSTVQSRVDVMAGNMAAIAVNAYDQNDGNPETYSVNDTYLSRGNTGGITYYGGTPGSLALYAGSGANTVGLPALGQRLDHFGTVSIYGGGQSDLTVNDQAASAPATYTLTADHLTRGTLGALPVTVNYARLKSLTLNTGWWASTVNIDSTPAPTTVVGGAHADQFNVGPNVHSLDGLVGALTLDGGSGGAAVVLNDQAHSTFFEITSPFYTVTAGSVQRQDEYRNLWSGQPYWTFLTINYVHVSHLELDVGTSVGNVISVESTVAPTDVHSGSGNSQVLITPTSQTLNSINGLLGIYGGYLTVNDQANPYLAQVGASVAYSVGSVSLTRSVGFLGRPPAVATYIQYAGLSGLTFYTRGAPNTVLVSSTPAATTINSGAADAITVGDFLGTVGTLTVNAHGGTLVLDDHVTSNSDDDLDTSKFTVGFTVTDQSVAYYAHYVSRMYYEPPNGGPGKWVTTTTNFGSTFNYANVSALTINGGPVDTAFGVQSTPAGMALTVNGSTGDRPKVLPRDVAGPTLNQFAVGGGGTVKNIRGALTFNGSGPADTLLLDDSAATTQDVVTVTGTQVGAGALDHFFGAGGGLTYGGISALTLNLSNAFDDHVRLTPSATTAFFLNASAAAAQAGHGAALDLDLTGVSGALDNPSGPYSGTWTFGNRKSVGYSGFARH